MSTAVSANNPFEVPATDAVLRLSGDDPIPNLLSHEDAVPHRTKEPSEPRALRALAFIPQVQKCFSEREQFRDADIPAAIAT